MLKKRNNKSRFSNEINAGSMADIAFLLLIFFLVTTTIPNDKGIKVQLPPWSDEEVDPTKLKERNVFSVLVNADNYVLVRGEYAKVTEIRERAKEFIMNPSNDPTLSERPTKAIISMKNDRGTKYGTYITVYNELKAAYDELWDEEAKRRNYSSYDGILEAVEGNAVEASKIKKEIRAVIPFVLSEAEPTDFGDES